MYERYPYIKAEEKNLISSLPFLCVNCCFSVTILVYVKLT